MIKKDLKLVFSQIRSSELVKKAFNYYLTHNTTFDNPYHNLNHTLAMMQLIIKYYHLYFGIRSNDQENLLVAAIFHDFNHSGGKFSDDINIENAISGFNDFMSKLDIEESRKEHIRNIIRSTQFPYTKEAYYIDGLLLRECDNLVCFFDDFFTQVLFGLKSEMHTNDIHILIQGEMNFLENSWSNLKLLYSKEIVMEYKDELIGFINDFQKTIE